MEPYFEDICQREIDGAATADERRILEERIAQDAQAAQGVRRCRELARGLSSVGLLEPPSTLVDDVMGVVEELPSGRTAAHAGFWARVGSFVEELRPRELVSFSVGVVLGVVLLFFVGSQHLRDFDDFAGVGSIGLPELDSDSVSRLSAPGLGELAARFGESALLTQVAASQAQEWTLRYDSATLRLVAVEAVGGSSGWMQHEQGRLQLRQRGGEQYRLLFEVSEGVMQTDLELTMKSRGSRFDGNLSVRRGE